MEDEGPAADADRLDVGEAVYERILQDLRRRGVVDAVAAPREARASMTGDPAPSGAPTRRSSTLPGAVVVGLLVALAVILLVDRPGAGGSRDLRGDGAFAFIAVQPGDPDEPVTYTSCRPIGVAVYPAGGPPDAEALVREAVGVVRSATGLDLLVIGSFGGAAPNWNFQAGATTRTDPISVSWQDSGAIAALTDDTAGLGGSPVFEDRDGALVMAAGTVALSRDYYAELAARRDHDEALAVLLHELGHVVGLAHVDDPGELMYQDNIGTTAFGPGDLRGLRLLGQGRCS